MSTTTGPAVSAQQVELAIGGMTCASCAARIEKKLNRMDGVRASVNYATEKARVSYGEGVRPEDLVATVVETGYTAELPAPPSAAADPVAGDRAGEVDETRPLRNRLLVSVALSVPVVAMAMVPPLQLTYWQWLSLVLAAPVAVWGALPFHRATWANLRHGAATMDTLIS
ncbi:MAG: cation transporter, partial [Pseudonocardiaceae bacterium]